ncbi:MAG: glycosyltransferase family 4 protein [Steroidobacteraceae bacterium]
MRIAYLINQYPKVSHSFIRREIQALERQGHEIMRIALRGWDGELVDLEDQIERKRSRYVLREGALKLMFAVACILLTRPVRFLQTLRLALRRARHSDRPVFVHLIYVAEACCIERWLTEAEIQHLHAHFGTNSAEVAMLVNSLGGLPWSFTVHGPTEFDKAQLIGLAEKVRRCTFAIAISSYARGQLYRFVQPEYWTKIHLVHCGLERAFYAESKSAGPKTNRLVCVGRLCEEKGQLLLIDAARRLTTAGTDVELVLAGDGEMRAQIEELVTSYNLTNKIRITGWISSEQVRDEILAAKALVLPTLAEGLPVVIMEAMALRRPVISTYIAGIPELVQPNKHGWLVPAGDVQALTEAMQACLDAPAQTLAQLGEAARERVLARHDVDVEARKLAMLFETTPSVN